MANLPSQFGLEYVIGYNVTARTRTFYSHRMGFTSRTALREALDHARACLKHAIAVLNARIVALMPVPHVNQIPDTFVDEFVYRFNIDADTITPADFTNLARDFRAKCRMVLHGIEGTRLEIVDVPIFQQGTRTVGYVGTYGDGHRGRIHLDFGRLRTETKKYVAQALIHEASHKFAATRDHAYAHQDAMISALSTDQLMENADSFATVVVNVHQKPWV